MSGQLGELVVEIRADIARFTESTTKAQYQAQKMGTEIGKSVSGIQAHFDKISTGVAQIAGVLAGVAGIGAFSQLVRDSIDTADEIGKLSQKIGVAVEDLSALKYAGSLADVSIEQLGVGLKQLNKNILDAAAGLKEQSAAFSALGVSLETSDGKLRSANDVLLDVSDIFSKMPDGVEKTALAMKLFGKSGSDMIPLLNDGKDGLRDMRLEAEKLGVVLSSDFTKKAEEFNDNLTRLKAASQGLGYTISSGLLPYLSELAESAVNASKSSGIKDLTTSLLEFDQAALNIVTGPTRNLFNKILPESMQIQPFELTSGKKRTSETKKAETQPVTDTLQRYLDSLNQDTATSKAEALQSKWNEELATLKAKLDAADPSLSDFQKKIAELNSEQEKLLRQEGAAEYADKIRAAFDKLKDFEGGKIVSDAMKSTYSKLEKDADERYKKQVENEKLLNEAMTTSLELSGEYVAAEELKQNALKKSEEYQTLLIAAEAGESDAIARLTTQTKQWAIDMAKAHRDALDSTRTFANNYKALFDELNDTTLYLSDDLNPVKVLQAQLEELGGSAAWYNLESEKVRAGVEKEIEYREKLAIAIAAGDTQGQSYYEHMIDLQSKLNNKISQQAEELKKVDNVQDGFLTTSSLVGVISKASAEALESGPWGSRGWANWSGRAVGGPVDANTTYIVGENGPEILHIGSQGGSITSNDNLGGVTVHGGVNVVLPNVSKADDYSSMVKGFMTELKRQQSRFLS